METIGLVAGGSGHTLTEELKKRENFVALVGGKSNDKGMDIANYTLSCDLRDYKSIITFFKNHAVEKLILGTGHILAFELAEVCEQNGILLSVDINACKLAKNKIKYKEYLINNKLPTPHYLSVCQGYSVNRVVDIIGLPCVVKSPVDKSLPQRATTKEELSRALGEVLAVDTVALVEEFIHGTDITIPVVANFLNTNALFVSYYSKAAQVGLKGFNKRPISYFSNTRERYLMSLAESAVQRTGVIGFCRVDMVVDDASDEPKILECNSVTVTGLNSTQVEFSEHFVRAENKRNNVNMAALLVDNALKIFSQKTKQIV